MTDFIIVYPNEQTLLAVANSIPGLTTDNVLNEGRGVFSLDGQMAFEWAITNPYIYNNGLARTFRVNGDISYLNSYVLAANGTMTIDSQAGTIVIVAGPVTMSAPLPADCPVIF